METFAQNVELLPVHLGMGRWGRWGEVEGWTVDDGGMEDKDWGT